MKPLRYTEAYEELISHKASGIRRLSWNKTNGTHTAIYLDEKKKMYKRIWCERTGTVSSYTPTEEDKIANDWECEHNFCS